MAWHTERERKRTHHHLKISPHSEITYKSTPSHLESKSHKDSLRNSKSSGCGVTCSLRQENCEFEASMGYTVRPFLMKQQWGREKSRERKRDTQRKRERERLRLKFHFRRAMPTFLSVLVIERSDSWDLGKSLFLMELSSCQLRSNAEQWNVNVNSVGTKINRDLKVCGTFFPLKAWIQRDLTLSMQKLPVAFLRMMQSL
jgi:hypothetical protein